MNIISNLADEAAIAYGRRENDLAHQLHAQAMLLAGEHQAGMEFIQAFARAAGEARKNRQDSVVCRLKDGAYRIRPASVSKRTLRRIWVSNGAAGHLPHMTSGEKRQRYSMLALSKG